MNLSQLRRIIKEELLNSLKENETIEKPGTKEKERVKTKPKRTLIPDKENLPDTTPAKAVMKEEDKARNLALANKIAQRFKK